MKFISKWHEVYGKPKKHDEVVSYEDPKNKIVKEFNKIASFKNKIVLDIGAGSGRHTFQYAKTAKKVYAVEPSGEHVKFINGKAKKNNIKNIEAKTGKVEKIPLKNNSVDIVASTFALGSRFVDKKKAIKEILRVLKPKGKMIIADAYCEGEFIDIWRTHSDKTIAGLCYNSFLELKELYDFKVKVINTSWEFPTVKKAIDLFGYLLSGTTKKYLKKNKKRKINMKVFIVYGRK